MYIPQVIVGIIGTLFVETVGLITYAMIWRDRNGKDNDNQSDQ